MTCHSIRRRVVPTLLGLLVLLLLASCATVQPPKEALEPPRAGGVFARLALDRQAEDRILAIDPLHVSDAEIRGALAKAPAPRVMLLQGGIYPEYLVMESYGHFITEMGNPQSSIRDPGTGAWSYSPYEDSARLAGILAWHYEHDGMRPMLVGHSQGGMQAIKILHELAGHFDPAIHVLNPWTGEVQERTTIVDPLTGKTRNVVGLSACYASVVGAGGAAFLLPNQWDMLDKLRSIPDTVDDFTGYFIAVDLIAWSFPGINAEEIFKADGQANVRNIQLPASYSHVMLPAVSDLGQDPQMRARLNAYVPGQSQQAALDQVPGGSWAADVWYSIKKHWVMELQRLIRARRGAQASDRLENAPGQNPPAPGAKSPAGRVRATG
jgi:hypothetical protein